MVIGCTAGYYNSSPTALKDIRTYEQAGDILKAAELPARLEAADPDMYMSRQREIARVYVLAADRLIKAGDLAKGERFLDAALELRSGYKPGLQLLKDLYCRLGLVHSLPPHLDRAEGYYRLVLALEPDHPRALAGLARLYTDRAGRAERDGDLVLAFQLYRTALSYRTTDQVAERAAEAHRRLEEERGRADTGQLFRQYLQAGRIPEGESLPGTLETEITEMMLEQGPDRKKGMATFEEDF